ncbi:unnamed protein product [Clonostachys byssicola]|uniref:Glycosyltransferase 2-like domain-containing protein n=1 Tax=Clonostachys byssicola TaxID=160290 RepID=A0A9N9UPN3_9HYPO|nr:unnamed protein product [Clonostachys byssicola]
MGVREVYQQGGYGTTVASPRHVSILRQVVNVLGCLASLPLYWFITVHCRWPVTLDLIITIGLAELNRYINEGRRLAFLDEASYDSESDIEEKNHHEIHALRIDEKSASPVESGSASSRLDCLAAIVGWREDPSLFTRALESYRTTQNCAFVLVGIDGNEAEDMDMVHVFNNVFPKQSHVIDVPEPLGEIAHRVRNREIAKRERNGEKINYTEIDEIAVRQCIQIARSLISQGNLTFSGPFGTRQLCLRQQHMHKKGIMFTTFIFALVISDIMGIEFLWSSDSDTLVFNDSLSRTVDAIAIDQSIGGASSGLVVHNGQESLVTLLAETVYWGELYLTRSTPAATASSDCQSGPSTIFRLAALPPILLPWYTQTIMGKRMIINEDRHLTTNLLKSGWGVVFASDVLTATDTPASLSRWLRQQVRWARATHIESLLQPRVYLKSHPLLFHGMAKREFGPVLAAIAMIYYFFTAKQLIVFSATDLFFRCIVGLVYNVLRNPHRLRTSSLKWVIPGIVFYHVPLPAVHLWSMLTLTADGWGTSMRANSEQAKKDSTWQAWWENGFFVIWMGVVAGSAARWMMTNVMHDLSHSMSMLVFFGSITVAGMLAWKATIASS